MTKSPIYSVIIPHRDSPELLRRCLKSIPDKKDIQVIIVDDNSSPQKVDFSYFPGSERKYTEVIYNKDNHGAGHARNLALPRAKGQWLLFADADDFYTDNAWELFGQHTNDKADIIYFGITSVDSDSLKATERFKTYNKYVQAFVMQPTQVNENLLRYRHDVPWGKMIRRSLVTTHNIIFGESRYCNDTLFSCRCALAAHTIGVEQEAAYCVTESQTSLTRQMSAEAIRIRFCVICEKNILLREHGLAGYQTPFLFYLRQAWHISPRLFGELIKTGNSYHCQWFREIFRWFKQIIAAR